VSDADDARAALEAAAALHQRVAGDAAIVGRIADAGRLLAGALTGGRQLLAFGNGGSATDAEHLVAELVGRFRRERRGLPALALTTDAAVLTSVANDYGYDAVFARQVEALGRPGDIAVGITTSGASANVNAALARARAMGLGTIGLTGRDGGETRRLVDVHVNVPGDDTARIQEVHRTILHVWCEVIEQALQGAGAV
jgi:D-sedoheptulose 7-phosphate isomerase